MPTDLAGSDGQGEGGTLRLFWENRAERSLRGKIEQRTGFDWRLMGKRRQGYTAAHMAQRAIFASAIGFTLVLRVACVRILTTLAILSRLSHLVLGVRIGGVVLAKRHRDCGIALQR